MKTQYRSLLSTLGVLLIFQLVVISFVNLKRPFWGDEAHFVATIRTFGNAINLDTLRTYNEMSGPLPFILYAIWGLVFGFEIHILRFFSVIIALLTYLLFHHLLYIVFKNWRPAIFTTIFFVVQPYLIGFSVFVFTDMLAILFLILVGLATYEERPILLTLALSAGLLTRQYLVFLVLALGVYYSLRYRQDRTEIDLRMLIALGISLIPLALLMMFWRGFSPDNELKSIYLASGFGFHPSQLSLYVSQLFIYLFPLVFLSWRSIYLKNVKIIVLGFLLSLLYWLIPITPSRPALEAGIETVGFFHRATRMLVGPQWEQFIFFIAFALGVPVLINICLDCWNFWKAKKLGFVFFCTLSILSFLIVMPNSYLGWEKYFIPVIPLASIYLVSKYLGDNKRFSLC